MSSRPPVELVRRGRDATLTLRRPPLNVLDLEALAALDRIVADLTALPEKSSPRVLWVQGEGERAFCAGVSVQDHQPESVEEMLSLFHRALGGLRNLPSISVAVIRGHCLGGGLELAMCCDLRIAGEDARFGQPEVDLGCYPPLAAALFPRLIGEARTLDLLLTGRTLGAAEAERWGLVQAVFPTAELEATARHLAGQLGTKSAAVTRLIKAAVRAGREGTFDTALRESERLYLEELCDTADMKEGLAAFAEKRQPKWKHC